MVVFDSLVMPKHCVYCCVSETDCIAHVRHDVSSPADFLQNIRRRPGDNEADRLLCSCQQTKRTDTQYKAVPSQFQKTQTEEEEEEEQDGCAISLYSGAAVQASHHSTVQ